MVRFITKRPGLTCLLVILACCVAFGPGRTGGYIHVHGIQLIVGAWNFVRTLVAG